MRRGSSTRIAGVTLTAILSLALGIGATVSVFSIIYAVLMNPWPYQGADRIANIALMDKSGKETGLRTERPADTGIGKSPFPRVRRGR